MKTKQKAATSHSNGPSGTYKDQPYKDTTQQSQCSRIIRQHFGIQSILSIYFSHTYKVEIHG